MWEFDASRVEPSAGFENWPVGWHPVMFTAVEEKPVTGDEPGFFLEFTMKALDGPMKDKTTGLRIDHKNTDQKRMDRSFKTMSAICHVMGVIRFNDPRQLLNIPFLVEATESKELGEDKKPTGRVFTRFYSFKSAQTGQTAMEVFRNAPPSSAPVQMAQATQPQQPVQQPAAGGWGGQPASPGPAPVQQPQGGQQWGGQPQGQPQPGPAPVQGGQWGGQAPQPGPGPGPAPVQQPQQQWGQQQPQNPQPVQQPQGQPQAWGGQPAAPQGGAAPWGGQPA